MSQTYTTGGHRDGPDYTLPERERVVTHTGMKKEMSRGQQTAWIIGAIVCCVLTYFIYDATVNPNLDGVNGYDRCSYWAYNHTRGGVMACRNAEMKAVYQRVADHEM